MVTYDVERASQVAARLSEAFATGGIFGTQAMPEDLAPEGVEPGSEAHLRFITLTVAIDYMRDADQLWRAGRETFADPATRYLYEPAAVAGTEPKQIEADMQRHGLSRKPEKDAGIWRQICVSLTRRFQGQVGSLLDFARMDAVRLLEVVRGGGFPYLRGQKIGPLWVRMLHDNCAVQLKRLDEVVLPVDIHTAQATVQLGCVRLDGRSGDWGELRSAVQWAWREALDGSEGYALQLDEPLWLLSRMGCRVTREWPCEFRGRCPVAEFCLGEGVRLSVGEEEWVVR